MLLSSARIFLFVVAVFEFPQLLPQRFLPRFVSYAGIWLVGLGTHQTVKLVEHLQLYDMLLWVPPTFRATIHELAVLLF